MTDLLSLAQKIIKNHFLCLSCLGRLFAALSTGLTNRERGRIILEFVIMDTVSRIYKGRRIDKKLLTSLIYRYNIKYLQETALKYGILLPEYRIHDLKKQKCEICNNIMENLDLYVEKIVDALSKYRINTFYVGVKSIPEIEKKEDEVRSMYKLPFGENIRNELSREIGKRLSSRTRLRYEGEKPDVTILVDPLTFKISITHKPIVLSGQFIKYVKDYPIFARICKKCRGKGCKECNYTGKLPSESIEYKIGETLMSILEIAKWRFSIQHHNDTILFRIQLINPHTDVDNDLLKEIKEKINCKLEGKAEILSIVKEK